MKNEKVANSKKICFPHRASPSGGPGSFQLRFIKQLNEYGWIVGYPDNMLDADVVFVVAGTRKILWLIWNKLRGALIVQRLDGITWQHKLYRESSIWEKIKPTLQNLIIKFIRDFLADRVIYQSRFVKQRWRQYAKKIPQHETIIYNAVDLDEYKPNLPNLDKPLRLLCVEGCIQNSDAYLRPIEFLYKQLVEKHVINSFVVIGDISESNVERLRATCPEIEITAQIPREEVRKFYPGSIFLCLEVNPPCPNSVIEALASGAPVIGYNTGSLAELVPSNAGFLAEYEKNPWKLEIPDLKNIHEAALQVIENFPEYSVNARRHAEVNFDVNKMSDEYIAVLETQY